MTIALSNFFRYYKGEPQQVEAVQMLEEAMPESLLQDKCAWVKKYREKPPEPEVSNSYEGVKAAARIAGAKFPECVAAQWALESGYGKYTSGKNNFFGIKGKGTACKTQEDYGNGLVTITDSFKDFASIQDCINWLVDRWYKDYRGYKGVNRASSRDECAALLKAEGYATDPHYVHKLIAIMNQH